MWTTYSGHLYRREEMSIDEDSEVKEVPLEEVLPEDWEILDGEDEELPWMVDRRVDRRWEDESEDVKRQFERDGYYTVPLGDKLKKLIREVYKEAK